MAVTCRSNGHPTPTLERGAAQGWSLISTVTRAGQGKCTGQELGWSLQEPWRRERPCPARRALRGRMPAQHPRSLGGGGGGRGRGMESAFECKRVQSQGRREARGVKGQAQQPWNLSSDSSEPAPGEGQVDLTEKLSEDGGWKRYGGNGGREG